MKTTNKYCINFLLVLTFGLVANNSFSQRYIFFLHNKFIEDNGPMAVHSQYGRAAYFEIIDSLRKNNFQVFSEIRKKEVDPKSYARKIIRQIDSLISNKVVPDSITVMGSSKGGFIAMLISTMMQNDKINYVFIASCNGINSDINFSGNILSIIENSDDTEHSCSAMKEYSTGSVNHYREVELNTGLKHGFIFKPLPEWLDPSVQWAKQNFDFIETVR